MTRQAVRNPGLCVTGAAAKAARLVLYAARVLCALSVRQTPTTLEASAGLRGSREGASQPVRAESDARFLMLWEGHDGPEPTVVSGRSVT